MLVDAKAFEEECNMYIRTPNRSLKEQGEKREREMHLFGVDVLPLLC